MSRLDVEEFYKQHRQAGEEYNARRFRSLGGEAASELELLPFQRWLADLGDRRLLDAGCGTGRVLSVLSTEELAGAVAVDSSPIMQEYLRHKYPQIRLIEGNLFDFEPDSSVDVITSLRVFDHFSLADQEVLLRRFKGFLRDGGRIIISFLVGPSLESLVVKMLRWGKMNYFNTPRQYCQLFSRCGLKATRTYRTFVLPRGILYRTPRILLGAAVWLDHVLGALAPWLCSYMTCELLVDEDQLP